MNLAGALQSGVDSIMSALRVFPGGSVEAVITPPGSAALAGIHVIRRVDNRRVGLGSTGTQRTGAHLLIAHGEYATKLPKGTTVQIPGGPLWVIQAGTRHLAWWAYEASRA